MTADDIITGQSNNPRPTILVVRNPDWETEVYTEYFVVDPDIIVVDLGTVAGEESDFDPDDEFCQEWMVEMMKSVAHLPEYSETRQHVESIVEGLVSGGGNDEDDDEVDDDEVDEGEVDSGDDGDDGEDDSDIWTGERQ